MRPSGEAAWQFGLRQTNLLPDYLRFQTVISTPTYVVCTLSTLSPVQQPQCLYYTITYIIYCMARNFGGLLKICYLAEFTLAVEPVLAIMMFIVKWLIERAGNLTGSWASFHSVRTKSMIKCNWKLNKSLLRLIWTVFVLTVFAATVYTSFGLPSLHWQTSYLFYFDVQSSLEKQCSHTQLSIVNSMPWLDWRI